MHLRDLINRIDQLANHGTRVLETKSVKNTRQSSLETVDEAEMVGFRSPLSMNSKTPDERYSSLPRWTILCF